MANERMSTLKRSRAQRSNPPTVRVRVGGWFEASATGWAVLTVPILLIAPLVFVLLRAWLG